MTGATRWFTIVRLSGLLLATCAMLQAAQAARAVDSQQSIDAGRAAFKSRGTYPWYDAQRDTLRPIKFRSPSPQRKPWNISLSWLNWVAWTVLGLVLGGVIFLLVRIALGSSWQWHGRKRPSAEPVVTAERVEALGFLAGRSRDNLLGEARRHYQQGAYSEAIIYLFSYELMQLDKFAFIELAQGKTNRQYLRETGQAQPLKKLFESTMVAFEDVFFGRRPLDRGGFEACWNQLPEFEKLVSRSVA